MKYFTSIYIKNSFSNIELSENLRKYTAFKVGDKFYRFIVLQKGLKNASTMFQRFMDNILKEYIKKTCIAYVDKILVFSKTLEQHKKDVFEVVERLKKYGLPVDKKKTEYFKTEIEFLGDIITENRIKPLVARIAKEIQYCKPPQNIEELELFLSILTHDKEFLPNLSTVLAVLSEFFKEGEEFRWTQERQEVFEEAKRLLAEIKDLSIPDLTKIFTLETYTTNIGIEAVLRQEGKVVRYLSNILSDKAQNYSILEKEILAAKVGMESFEDYLSKKKFNLLIEYKGIKSMKNTEVCSIPRAKNVVEFLKQLHVVTDPPLDSNFVNFSKESEEDKAKKIMTLHEAMNHRKTIYKDLQKQNVSVIQSKSRSILEKCQTCAEHDDKYINSNRYIDTTAPGEIVGINLIEKKGKLLIVLLDYYTQKLFTRYLSKKNEPIKKILKFLKETYAELPFKKIILNDIKKINNSSSISDWLEENKIKRQLISPYHYKPADRIKKAIGTLRQDLKKKKGFPFMKKLDIVTAEYNNSIHRVIGMTPNEALKEENRDKVNQAIEKYKKDNYTEYPKFKVLDQLLMENRPKMSRNWRKLKLFLTLNKKEF